VSEANTKPDRDRRSDIARTNQLIGLAERGDSKALVEVRQLFDLAPERWSAFGDVAANAQQSWVRVVSGENELVNEAVHRQLDRMKAELAGPSPTPLEGLLVDRILTCWIALQYAETIYAQNMSKLSINQAEFHQRRLDRAQRRYLDAIKGLVLVRRMLVPIVQVNIGERQVNLAAG
jgi:hypothetical protein